MLFIFRYGVSFALNLNRKASMKQLENRVNRLMEIISTGDMSVTDERFAKSLCFQFCDRNWLSRKQEYWVKALISQYTQIKSQKKKKDLNNRRHYVYAAACGDKVKIGYSVDPDARVRTLQTGFPGHLTVRWKKGVNGVQRAKALERLLHKKFRRFHVYGEWHDIEVLDYLKKNKKKIRQRASEAAEREILTEARKHI